jgi:hypothetical protein
MRREQVRITVDTRRHLRRNTTLRCSWLMAIRDPAVLYAAQSVRIQADDSEMKETLSLTEDYDMPIAKSLRRLRTKRFSESCLHESMCSGAPPAVLVSQLCSPSPLQTYLHIRFLLGFTRRFVGIVQIP